MKITLAFIKKEFLQIIRDPSSLIIAFVLPTLLLFIYTYGINLDSANIRLGIKDDDGGPAVAELIKSFEQNRFVTAALYGNREDMYSDLTRSRIRRRQHQPGGLYAKLCQPDCRKLAAKEPLCPRTSGRCQY